jgi:hypothetical protein
MILARFSGLSWSSQTESQVVTPAARFYVGGKLLGAVSMAIPFSDTHIGGITPVSVC